MITLLFTYQGVTKTIKEWAIEKGLNYDTLRRRISDGWEECNIFAPIGIKRGGFAAGIKLQKRDPVRAEQAIREAYENGNWQRISHK